MPHAVGQKRKTAKKTSAGARNSHGKNGCPPRREPRKGGAARRLPPDAAPVVGGVREEVASSRTPVGSAISVVSVTARSARHALLVQEGLELAVEPRQRGRRVGAVRDHRVELVRRLLAQRGPVGHVVVLVVAFALVDLLGQ